MNSQSVGTSYETVTLQQQWLIPEDRPDPLPIQRVQAALPVPLSADLIDSIVCQIRLTLQKQDDGVNQGGRDIRKPSWIWKCSTLNVRGQPTGPYHWPSATVASDQINVSKPQHELYLVFHTHEHSVSGNRPISVGRLSPTSIHSEFLIQWVASPMNYESATTGVNICKRGHISVHFQYSVGMGYLPPPMKQSWLHGGTIQTRYICRNVTVPTDMVDDLQNAELFSYMNIQPFCLPISNKKLSSFDLVLAYGDSILEQFVVSQQCQKDHNDRIDSSVEGCCCERIHFLAKVAQSLNSRTLSKLLNELDLLLRRYKKILRPKTALILNSALWDILSDEATMADSHCPSIALNGDNYFVWKEHLDSMAQYLRRITHSYPQISLFWLLPTAVHIHRVHLLSEPLLAQKAPQKIRRTKYMSASRTQQLFHYQKELLLSLNKSDDGILVQGLDIYEATYLSADWTLPGDGRHYRPALNQLMLSWFY